MSFNPREFSNDQATMKLSHPIQFERYQSYLDIATCQSYQKVNYQAYCNNEHNISH